MQTLARMLLLACLGAASMVAADGGAGAGSAPAPGTNVLEYTVIVTGGELLQGAVQDAHTPFLARTLLPIGAVCVGAHLVDDLADDLRGALQAATRRAPLVLVTGGLGPTLNDVTRETLADFTGIPLHEESAVVEELARRLQTTPAGVPENIRRQARVPVRGGHLPNAQGTAVGLIFDATPAVVVALPGPPRELQPMVHAALVPWLQRRFGLHELGPSLTLRFVGLGQSRIDQVIREHVTLPPGLVVSSQFEGGRVDFTFTLPRNGAGPAAQLAALEAAVRERLGPQLYATGAVTLEAAALERLRSQGGSLAVVEAGADGGLAGSLLRQPVTRALLAGAFSAPSEERLRRMLRIPTDAWTAAAHGEERLRLLARHARETTSAEWILVVGDVQNDGSGGFKALVILEWGSDRWERRWLSLRDSAEAGRASLVNQVLDWVRLLDPRAKPWDAGAGGRG